MEKYFKRKSELELPHFTKSVDNSSKQDRVEINLGDLPSDLGRQKVPTLNRIPRSASGHSVTFGCYPISSKMDRESKMDRKLNN
jgi:hypothetical protein